MAISEDGIFFIIIDLGQSFEDVTEDGATMTSATGKIGRFVGPRPSSPDFAGFHLSIEEPNGPRILRIARGIYTGYGTVLELELQ